MKKKKWQNKREARTRGEKGSGQITDRPPPDGPKFATSSGAQQASKTPPIHTGAFSKNHSSRMLQPRPRYHEVGLTAFRSKLETA